MIEVQVEERRGGETMQPQTVNVNGREIPTPGSEAAREQGCTCPTDQQQYGPGRIITTPGCLVHGDDWFVAYMQALSR